MYLMKLYLISFGYHTKFVPKLSRISYVYFASTPALNFFWSTWASIFGKLQSSNRFKPGTTNETYIRRFPYLVVIVKFPFSEFVKSGRFLRPSTHSGLLWYNDCLVCLMSLRTCLAARTSDSLAEQLRRFCGPKLTFNWLGCNWAVSLNETLSESHLLINY